MSFVTSNLDLSPNQREKPHIIIIIIIIIIISSSSSSGGSSSSSSSSSSTVFYVANKIVANASEKLVWRLIKYTSNAV